MARTQAQDDWQTITPDHDEILAVETGMVILSSDADPASNDGTAWRAGEKAPLVAGLTYSYRTASGVTSFFDRLRVS